MRSARWMPALAALLLAAVYTIPSDDPEKRIDYVYIVPGSGDLPEVLSCERALTEPVGGVYASDHVGVICRFRMP